ncbi:hypothetical protein EOD41_03120 [Mucilaginibacter limnophilus]|uniref:Uncharacterized protein n=1 Tax=Mucilaginibacter limnophilus TaxID=1932778 RepID=A0A437MZ46_9SPHI|nr:hypothetical protein [Mucilaginibacter limnophilus]RVU02942.1 hypothetical protein EOD41_03120 [Mucilaginibacter limnophilus]
MPYTLITAATSPGAYRISNNLGSENLLLGDYHDIPGFMVSSGKMIQLPNPASPSYAHQMLTLCLDKSIDTIYPLNKEEALLLNEATQLFNEYGINIIYTDEV